jgi:ADP-ribose pyrophosphatase YjhB (NUDIX family)
MTAGSGTPDPSPALLRSFSKRTPADDIMERSVCNHCGHVSYDNPKIVSGAVVLHEGRVLLCRRAIEPRKGFWTVPAGYMELGETPEQGALREALEEACASIVLDGLLAVYTVPRLSQVQLIYRARFAGSPQGNASFSPGPESLETALFAFDAIPWSDIAFPTVHWMLADVRRVMEGPLGAPFTNPPGAEDPTL